MARALTTGMATALTQKVKRPFLLIDLAFDSDNLRLWSGLGTLPWNGEDWFGGGTLLGISEIEETIEVRAAGCTLELSGVPSSLISMALAEDYQGRPATIWFGLFDEDGAIIPDPKIWRKGVMDVMEHEETGETANFLLNVESGLIALKRAEPRYYTSEDQQIDYAGDLFFDFVPGLVNTQVLWGRASSK